jgi:hypothetical protein
VTPYYGLPWFLEIDPAAPPIFESQAAYLRRLGLLLPGERPSAAAYEPEAIVLEAEPEPSLSGETVA